MPSYGSNSNTKRLLNSEFSKSNSAEIGPEWSFFMYPAGLVTTLHRPTSE